MRSSSTCRSRRTCSGRSPLRTSPRSWKRIRAIVLEGAFGGKCRAAYVQFDDGQSTQQDRAKFRAGHAGWQYGGKIVLLDDEDQAYTVLVHRLSRVVDLLDGDAALPMPQDRDTMAF